MLGEISGQYQSQVKGFLKIYHYVWNSLKVTVHGLFYFFILFIFQKMIWIFYWILKAFLKGAIVENALIFKIPAT